ncbi:roadblock/LC7 domain-containing protein [Methanothermobacter sp.]|uniref:roadblock/LC7 domain-containing protein n=1 Tax=Methanothermobacter sp. TaxID=1884223 RepID=UPI00262F5937|nr:roadblock/LC7 domain-containing protein [Methanothermobacter sp.]MDI9615299.1 roadblock/LC7 domain-containing protein [Methanothermobacter sp.]
MRTSDGGFRILEEIVGEILEGEGVEGVIVTDSSGSILYSRGASSGNLGSMASVMSDASGKLLKRAGQGDYQSAVIEFPGGKMVLLNDDLHLLVLADKRSNLGKLILLARRVMKKLSDPEILRQLDIREESSAAGIKSTIEPEASLSPQSEGSETSPTPQSEGSHVSGIPEGDKINVTIAEQKAEARGREKETVHDISTEVVNEVEVLKKPDIGKPETLEEKIEPMMEGKVKGSQESPAIPEVRPPLSLPELKSIDVPADPEARKETALLIYEHILLAMSIGASKIMGVAPAGGMLRKSLPHDECPITLEGLGVLSNASVDFKKLRENISAAGYSLEEIKRDMEIIITSITENYGRVMGYGAFRGMIRPEFTAIYMAYQDAMDELGITETIHPELRQIWD